MQFCCFLHRCQQILANLVSPLCSCEEQIEIDKDHRHILSGDLDIIIDNKMNKSICREHYKNKDIYFTSFLRVLANS